MKHAFWLRIPDHRRGTAWHSRTVPARFSAVRRCVRARRGIVRRGALDVVRCDSAARRGAALCACAARHCAARRFGCGAVRLCGAARFSAVRRCVRARRGIVRRGVFDVTRCDSAARRGAAEWVAMNIAY